jgi:hypothetical protein
MLSFLVSHYKKHKTSLITISGVAAAAFGFLWNFDLQKLTSSGTMPAETLWAIRILMTPILASLYFLSLLITTLYHYKKDLDPITITPEERERILKALNSDKAEIELLKKDLNLHKKYLKQYAPAGFSIANEEAFEKGFNSDLSKPTEPASASSDTGPDDYHAPRRSFFNFDNDHPKR